MEETKNDDQLSELRVLAAAVKHKMQNTSASLAGVADSEERLHKMLDTNASQFAWREMENIFKKPAQICRRENDVAGNLSARQSADLRALVRQGPKKRGV